VQEILCLTSLVLGRIARKNQVVPRVGMLVAALVLLSAGAHAEGVPWLALPIDCEIGKTCIVQNYVDHDAGPGARDYRCGWLTYDGHKGTDIRVIDGGLFKRGVAVLAAAAGRVRAVRDGMRDVSVRTIGKAAVARREAGNSVVIEHGDGWESQYAHMREGSVAVRAGDMVQPGERLGVVGLSGATEFPHLHFEIRYRGKPVDPFTGVEQSEPCKAGDPVLWQRQAYQALAYVPIGVLDAGIAGVPPVVSDGFVDRDKIEGFTSASGTAVFWVQTYGAQANDLEEFRLIAPGGRVLAERRDQISRNRAQWLAYVGIRRGNADWAGGAYRGEYALYRGPHQLISLERAVKLASP
jgi:peptidase M23-like protein